MSEVFQALHAGPKKRPGSYLKWQNLCAVGSRNSWLYDDIAPLFFALVFCDLLAGGERILVRSHQV